MDHYSLGIKLRAEDYGGSVVEGRAIAESVSLSAHGSAISSKVLHRWPVGTSTPSLTFLQVFNIVRSDSSTSVCRPQAPLCLSINFAPPSESTPIWPLRASRSEFRITTTHAPRQRNKRDFNITAGPNNCSHFLRYSRTTQRHS